MSTSREEANESEFMRGRAAELDAGAAEEPSASAPTTTRARTRHDAFFERAITWLRGPGKLHTEVLPTHRLEESEGRSRIRGHLLQNSRAGQYGYASLWAFTIGIVLVMLWLPTVSAETRQIVHSVGYATLLLGAALLALTGLSHLRSRRPVLVELWSQGAPNATAISRLHDDARGDTAWVVAERTFDREALAAASRLGVTCFEGHDRAFRERKAEA